MTLEQWDQPIDWQELDRLVDGQLSDQEYRELIAEIELYPNGWRQCALAFLEHQALQREMGDIQEDCRQAGEASALKANATASNWLAWLTMVTCIAVGVTLGLSMQTEFRESIRGRTLDEHSNTDPLIGNYNNFARRAPAKENDETKSNHVNLRMSSPDFAEKIRVDKPAHQRVRIHPTD